MHWTYRTPSNRQHFHSLFNSSKLLCSSRSSITSGKKNKILNTARLMHRIKWMSQWTCWCFQQTQSWTVSFKKKNHWTWHRQLMMNALRFKDNANNVYKENVKKWGTFEGIRLVGQEEKRYRAAVNISVTGPSTFQLSSAVMYIACTT